MRVSYTWLKELLAFPYSPRELADVLTRQGMTVDALDRFGRPYDHVVVGELVEVQKHPNADALSVCKVNVGTETLQIVCGAPNIKAGQRVPVALPGAKEVSTPALPSLRYIAARAPLALRCQIPSAALANFPMAPAVKP